MNLQHKHFNNSLNNELNYKSKLSGHLNSVEVAKFIKFDHGKIISGSHDKKLKIWDYEKQKVINEVTPFDEGIWQLSISKNKIIYLISSKGNLKTLDYNNLKEINTVNNIIDKGYSLKLCENENNLLLSGMDNLKILDTNKLDVLKTIEDKGKIFYDFKNIKNYFVSSNNLGILSLYDKNNYELVNNLKYDNTIYEFDYNHDTNELFIGDEKGNIVQQPDINFSNDLSNYNTKPIYFKGHTDAIKCLKLNKNILFSGSRDSVSRIWDLKDFNIFKTLTGHIDQIVNGDFHPTKNLLATSSWDQTINIYDISDINK